MMRLCVEALQAVYNLNIQNGIVTALLDFRQFLDTFLCKRVKQICDYCGIVKLNFEIGQE
jgi:hypothetical protein